MTTRGPAPDAMLGEASRVWGVRACGIGVIVRKRDAEYVHRYTRILGRYTFVYLSFCLHRIVETNIYVDMSTYLHLCTHIFARSIIRERKRSKNHAGACNLCGAWFFLLL